MVKEQLITMKQAENRALFHAGILLGLFFDSDEAGHMFLRNVG
jgi:hypothetical protein